MKTSIIILAITTLVTQSVFSQNINTEEVTKKESSDQSVSIKQFTVNEILGLEEFSLPEENIFELMPGEVFMLPEESIQESHENLILNKTDAGKDTQILLKPILWNQNIASVVYNIL